MTIDLVSVVIPSYNHKRYIEELLISIRDQTYTNIEIIVIDDGSSDGSQDFLKSIQEKYNIQLICKSNEGLCATINKGLDLIKGKYVVIIASDDFMPKSRIEEQVNIISNSSFDVISGGMTIVDEFSQVIGFYKPKKIGEISFDEMLFKNYVCAPTVMFKSHVFEQHRYNPSIVIEDLYMWLKILSHGGRISIFDYNWAFYRKMPHLTQRKIEWYYKGLEQVLSQYSDRDVVKKARSVARFKYLIKTALFNDLKQMTTKVNQIEHIAFAHKIFAFMIAILPNSVKILLRKILNLT